jgi:DNA-binding transcriptional ArsR family regulator
MAEDLLARVVREIRERRQAAQAAYEESERLERALAALGSGASSAAAADADSPRRQRRGQRRRRAAPGAKREAIVAVLRERPGTSAGEIAQATGIPRSTVSPTLSRLIAAGAVERISMPGGDVGFRPAAEPPSAPTDSNAADGGSAEVGDAATPG